MNLANNATPEDMDRKSSTPDRPAFGQHIAAMESSTQLHKYPPSKEEHHTNVDVHHFDPSGVAQLGRTLSRAMTHEQSRMSGASEDSAETFVVEGEAFDLEKVLRHYMKQ